LEAVFILLEFPSPSRRIFIGSHSLPPSLVRRIGPSEWAKVPITFTEQDFKLKSTDHNDAMVIEVNIVGWVIGKVLVDNRSSTDILFMKTFEKMSLTPHMLQPKEYPLLDF
jgi:hypothetical protein